MSPDPDPAAGDAPDPRPLAELATEVRRASIHTSHEKLIRNLEAIAREIDDHAARLDAATPEREAGGELRLRTGRKVGRTIYTQLGDEPSEDDPLIGVMDTAELAATVVDAVNGAAVRPEPGERDREAVLAEVRRRMYAVAATWRSAPPTPADAFVPGRAERDELWRQVAEDVEAWADTPDSHVPDGLAPSAPALDVDRAAEVIEAGLRRVDPETVARWFHEAYERLAPAHNYCTREQSAVPWDDVPGGNRALMTATAAEVLTDLARDLARDLAQRVAGDAGDGEREDGRRG